MQKQHKQSHMSLAHPPTFQLVFVQSIRQIPHVELQCSCLLCSPRRWWVFATLYCHLLVNINLVYMESKWRILSSYLFSFPFFTVT